MGEDLDITKTLFFKEEKRAIELDEQSHGLQ